MPAPDEAKSNDPWLELLAYLKDGGLNFSELEQELRWVVPSLLLTKGANAVSVVVNMILNDAEWNLSWAFSEMCQPFKTSQPCPDVENLKKIFIQFVHEVMFKNSVSKETDTRPKKRIPKKAPSELSEIETIYNEVEVAVDNWSEKYDDLIKLVDQYIVLLGKTYNDPRPESWLEYDEDKGDSDVLDYEHIPNKFLNVLCRIINMFKAKTDILESKIKKAGAWSTEGMSILQQLDTLLCLVIAIKELKWDIFDTFWTGKNDILSDLEWIIHKVNIIKERNK